MKFFQNFVAFSEYVNKTFHSTIHCLEMSTWISFQHKVDRALWLLTCCSFLRNGSCDLAAAKKTRGFIVSRTSDVPSSYWKISSHWDHPYNTSAHFGIFLDPPTHYTVKFGHSDFWEGHKIWNNLPFKIWRYRVTSNWKWKIFSNFVPFFQKVQTLTS